jgi:hypothetical protein
LDDHRWIPIEPIMMIGMSSSVITNARVRTSSEQLDEATGPHLAGHAATSASPGSGSGDAHEDVVQRRAHPSKRETSVTPPGRAGRPGRRRRGRPHLLEVAAVVHRLHPGSPASAPAPAAVCTTSVSWP